MTAVVRKFLDLSTGFLTQATRDRLDSPGRPVWCCYPHPDGFGWFVYVDTDDANYAPGDDAPYPPDLRDCMLKARALGCDYICFDVDGPDHCDGLTWHEEEEPTS